MHDDLKRRLRDEVDAQLGSRPMSDLSDVMRRGRGKRLVIRLTAMASMVLVGTAILAGGLWIGRSLSSDDAAPVPPAEKEREGEAMVNGRLLHSNTAPIPPGEDGPYVWEAFDQDAGSFLFYSFSRGDVRSIRVVDTNGPIAEFDCPPSADCESVNNLGPGADEVTVTAPASENDGRIALVIDFDGGVRDTVDISSVTGGPSGQELSNLAWSPDGSRLAISTEGQALDCGDDPPCTLLDHEANVWIFDRDGGEPQLVHSERTPEDSLAERPTVVDLAWSPDGRSLALVASPEELHEVADEGVWPRLVVLRSQPGRAAQADMVHVYDDYDWEEKEFGALATSDDDLHFAFAWSPDGTRIAVTSEGGIAEISAEDGEVLVRHPGDGLHGPLAWLPKQ